MKKLLAVFMILVLSLATVSSVYADDMVVKSVDAVVSEIRADQGIKTTEQINPDKVSQAMLEELGDSVMEAMIGNTAIHDQMDINMGGDGSATLTAMHVRIGYHYLNNLQKGLTGINNENGFIRMRGTNGLNVMMGNPNWGMTRGFALNGMMGIYGFNNMMGNNSWNNMMGNDSWNINMMGYPNWDDKTAPPSGWNKMNSDGMNSNWNGMMD